MFNIYHWRNIGLGKKGLMRWRVSPYYIRAFSKDVVNELVLRDIAVMQI